MAAPSQMDLVSLLVTCSHHICQCQLTLTKPKLSQQLLLLVLVRVAVGTWMHQCSSQVFYGFLSSKIPKAGASCGSEGVIFLLDL